MGVVGVGAWDAFLDFDKDLWRSLVGLVFLHFLTKTMNTILQTICDTYLNDILNQIIILQENYKTGEVIEDLGTDERGNPITRTYTRDKYFQLLETHSVIPADGVTKAEDVDGKTPTDQKENYADFGLDLGVKQPCSISISPYEGPNGWGFELRAKVIDQGITYQRVINYGDEDYREQAWTKLPSTPKMESRGF